jgi:hypothetical protein
MQGEGDGPLSREENVKPKIVVLCGSSRFVDIMAVCAWLIERDEHAIALSLHLLPWWYGAEDHHQAETEGIARQMDDLHLRKIDLADEVFVVCPNFYMGESTAREVDYANRLLRPIRMYPYDPIGKKVQELIECAKAQGV